MLQETIAAALALLPPEEEPARLGTILTTAREELSSGEETDEPQSLQRQIHKAADLLRALYGREAADRARRIAAAPNSTPFSRLVLADVEGRRSR